jgi:hypothetical protein
LIDHREPELSAFVKLLKQEKDRVEKQLSGLNAALTAKIAAAACAMGQVQEVGQEVRVSVLRRQPHEE